MSNFIKKMCCIGIAFTIFFIPVSARQHFAATIDPMPFIISPLLGGFGGGGSFEYAPFSLFSLKLGGYYIGGKSAALESSSNSGSDTRFSMYNLNGAAQLYPFKTAPGGFFLNGGVSWLGMSDTDSASRNSLDFVSIFAGIGYKVVFGADNAVGFFFEPSMRYNFCFSSSDLPSLDVVGLLLGAKGFSFGLSLGLTF